MTDYQVVWHDENGNCYADSIQGVYWIQFEFDEILELVTREETFSYPIYKIDRIIAISCY